MYHQPHRGFTLLIAVILSSVALSLGIALLDIAFKQVVLASAARQSQNAFYRADTAMECALYFDQVEDAFGYSAAAAEIQCANSQIEVVSAQNNGVRRSTFDMPCEEGDGVAGQVTILKASDATTAIYASGYNTCDVDNERRIERALKVTY